MRVYCVTKLNLHANIPLFILRIKLMAVFFTPGAYTKIILIILKSTGWARVGLVFLKLPSFRSKTISTTFEPKKKQYIDVNKVK